MLRRPKGVLDEVLEKDWGKTERKEGYKDHTPHE